MSPQPSSPHPDRRLAATAKAASRRESAFLETAFDHLDRSDAALLIQVIAKVVEIERTHGEDVALAMLKRAMAHDAEGRALH